MNRLLLIFLILLSCLNAPVYADTVENFNGGVVLVGLDRPFNLAVTMGMLKFHSKLDKFGENPDVDTGTVPEDIWEGGGEYTYDTNGTAPITSLASNSSSDTQDVLITGLDVDGNEVNQTLTLQGTTRVALTTPLWRVYRAQNEGAIDFAGTVFIYTGTGSVPIVGASEVRAIIDGGHNQTLMALYTVPKGKVGYLFRGEIGISRSQTSGAVEAAYYARRYGKVFKIKKRVDLVNSGSSSYQDSRSFPDVVPALTDLKLTIEDVSANNAGIYGTFDILLIDEDKFEDSYLEAIGQPGY